VTNSDFLSAASRQNITYYQTRPWFTLLIDLFCLFFYHARFPIVQLFTNKDRGLKNEYLYGAITLIFAVIGHGACLPDFICVW
jgi:hypothetical protein